MKQEKWSLSMPTRQGQTFSVLLSAPRDGHGSFPLGDKLEFLSDVLGLKTRSLQDTKLGGG